MKTEMFVRSGIIAKKFDETSCYSSFPGFNPHWDYKHYNEYISQKNIILSTIKKIHFKCDVMDGSVVNGVRQPILFSFVLDIQTGYKVFSQPEALQCKNLKITV